MKKSLWRVISILLCIGMIFTMSSPMAWTTEAYAADGSTWTEVTDIAAAAASDKPIAITMTKGTTTWVLPTAKANSSGPTAMAGTVADGKLTGKVLQRELSSRLYVVLTQCPDISCIDECSTIELPEEVSAILGIEIELHVACLVDEVDAPVTFLVFAWSQ